MRSTLLITLLLTLSATGRAETAAISSPIPLDSAAQSPMEEESGAAENVEQGPVSRQDIDELEEEPVPAGAEKAGDAPGPASAGPDATPLQVAPNLDLKEVAPIPAPVNAPKAETADPAPAASPTEGQAADTEAEGREPPVMEAEAVAEPPAEPAPQAESLFILGAEVKPGTATRLGWSPDTAGAGLSQPTPVLIINGENPGPTLCLTAALHGDELNGIEIVRRVMYDTDPSALSGRLIGVPIVNVQGFQQGSRYMPDRRDLNRNFPGDPRGSLAARVAHSFFNEVVRHCDMLVDIHTGSLKRTNLPQLRADMNNGKIAEFTRGFDGMAVVHGAGNDGMLRTEAIKAGITAVTLEAGESHRVQKDQIKAGVNSINSLLERQKMMSRLFVWGDPEPVYYESDWIRTNVGGILSSEVELGDDVVKGELLGVVTDPITNERFEIIAKGNGRVIGMAVDQVVMAGFATYHIGAKARGPGAQ